MRGTHSIEEGERKTEKERERMGPVGEEVLSRDGRK